MSEASPIKVPLFEGVTDPLAQWFIDTISDLSVNSLDMNDETLRKGRFMVPQLGPIPYDTVETSVVSIYGESPEDYDEFYELRVFMREDGKLRWDEDKLRIVYDKGTFYVDELDDKGVAWTRGQVAIALEWLSGTTLHPDAYTMRAQQRLSHAETVLGPLAVQALEASDSPAQSLIVPAYDPFYEDLSIKQVGNVATIALIGKAEVDADLAKQKVLEVDVAADGHGSVALRTYQKISRIAGNEKTDTHHQFLPSDATRVTEDTRAALVKILYKIDQLNRE